MIFDGSVFDEKVFQIDPALGFVSIFNFWVGATETTPDNTTTILISPFHKKLGLGFQI